MKPKQFWVSDFNNTLPGEYPMYRVEEINKEWAVIFEDGTKDIGGFDIDSGTGLTKDIAEVAVRMYIVGLERGKSIGERAFKHKIKSLFKESD